MRNEYIKVFNFYQVEMTERLKLEEKLKEKTAEIVNLQADLQRLVDDKILKEVVAIQHKSFKVENKRLLENYENRCLEVKKLKNEIENVKKDQNELSVALKRSKKENKEYIKTVQHEKGVLEKKIVDLNEYKMKKVNEERDERMRRKKELKKINQKEKKVSKDDNENIVDGNNSNTAETKPIPEDLAVSDEAKHTVEPNEKLNKDEEVSNGVLAVGDPVKEPDTTCVTVNESDEADGIKVDIPKDEALTESDHTISENELMGKLNFQARKAQVN